MVPKRTSFCPSLNLKLDTGGRVVIRAFDNNATAFKIITHSITIKSATVSITTLSTAA
jgi:hypothetical protein